MICDFSLLLWQMVTVVVVVEEVRIADLCFSPSVLAAIAEDPIDHDDNSDDDATGEKIYWEKVQTT